MKWMMIALGLSALLIGAVTFWLPLPIGLPLLLLGGFVLLKHSQWARAAMALLLRRSPRAKVVYRKVLDLRQAAEKRLSSRRGRASGIRQGQEESKPGE